MGKIEVESWNVNIDDIDALNNSSETSRLGLRYEGGLGFLDGSAEGNVSATYVLLSELRRRIKSGSVRVSVTFSNGNKSEYLISDLFAHENGKDISNLIR